MNIVMQNSLLFITIACLWHLATAIEDVATYPILEPISDEGWENNLNRRSTDDYLKLASNDHFVWSSTSDNGDSIFVNMTMSTGEEELIISMERFSSMLKGVSCSDDMILTFNSNESYSSAVASWDWVNFNENRTFIMIANYPGCGAAKSRQPWIISSAAYDPENLIVHLNATEKTWKEVAHTYSLDFGRYSPPASTHRRQYNGDPSFSIDLNHGITATVPTGSSNITLTCTCGTQGKLVLDGHIESALFKITVFTVTAKPVGIEADLTMGLSVSNTNPDLQWKPDPWKLLSIPIGGFSIPDIITIGPALDIGFGVVLTAAKSTATISQTIKAMIPNSATAEVSLAGARDATFSGWEPQFEIDPPKVDLSISASAEAYGLVSLDIGIDIFDQGIDLLLSLQAPDFIVTATPVFNTNCAGKSVHAGVSLKTSVGAVLGLKAASHVDGVETDFLNKTLYTLGASTAIPRLSTCIPLL